MKKLKITSIKKLGSKRRVYDLSVDGNHNFIIGKNGILTSNCDFFTVEAQAALRNLMETYSLTTRFILTCNHIEKIMSPLISRCQVFEISPPSKMAVALHIKNILDIEKVKYELTDIKTVVDDFYPDVRKTINYSQQSSSTGTLIPTKSHSASYDIKNKLIGILRESSNSNNTYNNIRQLVNDAGTKIYDDLYGELYRKVGEYAPKKESYVILTIAESLYQSSIVVDKEITFMACILKILNIITK